MRKTFFVLGVDKLSYNVLGDKMKKIKEVVSQVKDYGNQLMLNCERITVSERKKVFIENYNDILEITDDFIKFKELVINGNKLRIISVSKYFMEIAGQITGLTFLGDKDE